MLLLIAGLIVGVLLYRKNLRLEGVSDMTANRTVHAYVDGKPVDSYVKE